VALSFSRHCDFFIVKTLIPSSIIAMANVPSDDALAKICLLISDIMALCDGKPALEAMAIAKIQDLTAHFHTIIAQRDLASNQDTAPNPPSPPPQVEHSPTIPESNPSDAPPPSDSSNLPVPTD
jgi:hypothetical protein